MKLLINKTEYINFMWRIHDEYVGSIHADESDWHDKKKKDLADSDRKYIERCFVLGDEFPLVLTSKKDIKYFLKYSE